MSLTEMSEFSKLTIVSIILVYLLSFHIIAYMSNAVGSEVSGWSKDAWCCAIIPVVNTLVALFGIAYFSFIKAKKALIS